MIININENSLFTVKSDFNLSTSDEKNLSALYLPLLGSESFALYHVLVNRAFMDSNEILGSDLVNLLNVSLNALGPDFLRLEALGLVRTFQKTAENNTRYLILLSRPLSSFDFLMSEKGRAYRSALGKKIGEKELVHLKADFKVLEKIPSDYMELTSSFNDVYEEDEDLTGISSRSGETLNNYLYNEKTYENKKFSLEELKEKVRELKGDPASFKKDEEEIMRISSLYGLSLKETASLITDKCTNSDGIFSITTFSSDAQDMHHFAFKRLEEEKSEVFGNSDYARRIKLAESRSPLDYLSLALGGNEPPLSYRRTLDKLSSVYRAPNGVINAVIDYTVLKTEGSFPEQYAIKVLLPILKKNITSAGEALSFLYQREEEMVEKKKNREEIKRTESVSLLKEKVKKPEEEKEENEEEDDFDIDKITGGLL